MHFFVSTHAAHTKKQPFVVTLDIVEGVPNANSETFPRPPLAFVGDARNELIFGTNGADVLDGAGGIDVLVGLGGDDVLRAGDDSVADYLHGGDGQLQFFFSLFLQANYTF
jgi:Ca2+-binding RTX toxin-like protein